MSREKISLEIETVASCGDVETGGVGVFFSAAVAVDADVGFLGGLAPSSGWQVDS
jgi:hypothetical protein